MGEGEGTVFSYSGLARTPERIIIRWLGGEGEGTGFSYSGLARTPERTSCGTTGTKGSSSTSGRDSEGVMK